MNLKETIKMKGSNFIASIKTAALVVGSATIIFAALRNSLTWHIQHFWGASGDLWQEQWRWILRLTGEDEFLLYIVGPFLASFISFWLCSIPLLIMDFKKKPHFLYQYKIQADKNIDLKWKEVCHAIKVTLGNQVFTIFVTCLFYPLFKWRGLMKHGPELPTFQWVLVELCVFVLIEELLFYYAHRILHHRLVYKHVHKIHHEWTAPVCISAIYCHPFEAFFSNLAPVLCGPLVYGSHLSTTYMWVVLATVNTINAHSGYHFPGFPSNEAHDFHHVRFNEMFGVLGILDRLHNTDANFRASKQFQRHLTFYSLTPIDKLFPDENKNVKQISCPRRNQEEPSTSKSH